MNAAARLFLMNRRRYGHTIDIQHTEHHRSVGSGSARMEQSLFARAGEVVARFRSIQPRFPSLCRFPISKPTITGTLKAAGLSTVSGRQRSVSARKESLERGRNTERPRRRRSTRAFHYSVPLFSRRKSGYYLHVRLNAETTI